MKTSPLSKNIDTIIFDFDGVIADSGAIFTETLEEILKRPKPFTDEEIKQMRNSSTREIIKMLEVKKWQLPTIMIKGKRGIAAKMHTVEVFKDMPEAIKALHADGYKLYILSTNNDKAIRGLLDKYGLTNYVSGVYSATSLFGKAKRLKALLRKENVDKDQCVYVGDETRDIEATKQVGMYCVAVEWGYSAPSALKSYAPEAMASHPRELRDKIKGMNS
jgi:phosphoglycolate phosphatase